MTVKSGALIRTKLHRPHVAGDLVPRLQLLGRLERRRQRPLTLISAPAGYGKTSLVTSWLEDTEWPCAWVSLDEYDDDLATALAPYRRFRHVASHSYGFQLDWDRIVEGIRNVGNVFAEVK